MIHDSFSNQYNFARPMPPFLLSLIYVALKSYTFWVWTDPVGKSVSKTNQDWVDIVGTGFGDFPLPIFW